MNIFKYIQWLQLFITEQSKNTPEIQKYFQNFLKGPFLGLFGGIFYLN